MTKLLRIDVLVATMNRDEDDFLDQMFPEPLPDEVTILIVNQSDVSQLTSTRPSVKVLNTTDKGLSKSRNKALAATTADICVFADDDVVFLPGFAAKISRAYQQLPHCDFIRFRYECAPGITAKSYPSHPKTDLSWTEVLSCSSLEMTLRPKAIRAQQLAFDDRFGLGSDYVMGEEQVFLGQLKQAEIAMGYEPETLMRHPTASSTEKIDFETRYRVQGAMTKTLFGAYWWKWVALKIGFDLKQGKLKLNQLITALHAANSGAKIQEK